MKLCINNTSVRLTFSHGAHDVGHRRRLGRIADTIIHDCLRELRLSFKACGSAEKFNRAARGEILVSCHPYDLNARFWKIRNMTNAECIPFLDDNNHLIR